MWFYFTGGPDWVKHNRHKASGETLDQQLPVHLTQHRGGNGLRIVNQNKSEVVKHVAVTAGVPHRRSLMIMKPMIPGCSSSLLTWSSSWQSSRYLVWATFQLYVCFLSIFLNSSVSPHQMALSPIIYDTLTSLMTSLISITMEKTVLKCSFSRVRSRARPQGGIPCITSHHITDTHTCGEKPQAMIY